MDVTVTHEHGRWIVRQHGIDIAECATKRPAVRRARERARRYGLELTVHTADGDVQDRTQYPRNNGW